MLIMTFLSSFACDWPRGDHVTPGEVRWRLLGKCFLPDKGLAHEEKVPGYPALSLPASGLRCLAGVLAAVLGP